jgi:hypothetical protein
MLAALGAATAATIASTASATASNADLEISLGASATAVSGAPPLTPNGGTVSVTSRAFTMHVDVSLISPAPGGRPKVRVVLGGGLRWGEDDPDATEGCTNTPTTGDCQSPVDLQPVVGQSGGGWFWDVVAPADGTYTLSAELYDLAQPDPVPSNNTSTITVVVKEASGSSGGSGQGGSGSAGSGGGGSTVVAGALKLSPAKPKAGSTVVASARVTRGGSALRPSSVTCAASVGKGKVKGTPKAASGLAACAFRTPKSAKGKSLVGSVSFRAGGQRFVKRFATRLG